MKHQILIKHTITVKNRRPLIERKMFANIGTIIVLTAFISTSEAVNGVWNSLTAKWSQNVSDGFYNMPQNLTAARYQGWTRIPGIDLPAGQIGKGFCGDPRITLIFQNSTGQVIGMQVGVPAKDIDSQHMPINYEHHSYIIVNILNGKKYYTGTAYFRQNDCGNSRSIWLKRRDGTLSQIPTKPELLVKRTSYELKKCITWMGLHYYRINSETKCNDIPPWFLLRKGNNIIGIGFQIIGTASSGPKRTWFETIPLQSQTATIPDAPTCLGIDIKKYGLVSFHLWFINDPLSLQCDTIYQD